MSTWKNKFNRKYKFDKDKSHSIAAIARLTGYKLSGLRMIYKRGLGAHKTNLPSVRLKGSFKKNPNVKKYGKSKRLPARQWAQASVYSAVMGGKAAKVDAKYLKKS